LARLFVVAILTYIGESIAPCTIPIHPTVDVFSYLINIVRTVLLFGYLLCKLGIVRGQERLQGLFGNQWNE
jgi:hypothetical protein